MIFLLSFSLRKYFSGRQIRLDFIFVAAFVEEKLVKVAPEHARMFVFFMQVDE